MGSKVETPPLDVTMGPPKVDTPAPRPDLTLGAKIDVAIPAREPPKSHRAKPVAPEPAHEVPHFDPPTHPGPKISIPRSSPPSANDDETAKKPKKKRFLIAMLCAGFAIALVSGGVAMQWTSWGAFGYLAINDAMFRGRYASAGRDAQEWIDAALRVDSYEVATETSARLKELGSEMPRAVGLATRAAIFDTILALRFNVVQNELPAATRWLRGLPESAEDKYFAIARVADIAARGDSASARKALDMIALEPGDPMSSAVAILHGEMSLTEDDPAGASRAFTTALASADTAAGHFGIARALTNLEDGMAAERAIVATLAINPSHAGALLLQAASEYRRSGNADAVIAAVQRILAGVGGARAAPSEQAEGYALVGMAELERGVTSEARAAFDKAAELSPRSVGALVGQGEVFFREGRFTEALNRFAVAEKTDPYDVDSVTGAAKARLALGQLEQAKASLVAARSRLPKNMWILYWLAQANEALGDKAAAEKEYLAAIEVAESSDPEASLPYMRLALLLLSDGRTDDARAKIAAAGKRLAPSASLERALGEIAAAEGNFDGALSYFRHALELNPRDLSIRFRMAVLLRSIRQFENAAAQLDRIIAIDPKYPGIALERGVLFEQAGDANKALAEFKAALAKAPDDLDLQLRIGAAYIAIDRPEEALEALKGVLAKRPSSAEVQHFVGRALFAKGAPEAMRYLQRAVELEGNQAEYHLALARAANESSPAQLGLARVEVEKAIALDQTMGDAYWVRGALATKEGALDNALIDLTRALQLLPGEPAIHASMAELWEAKNKLPQAMSEWATAIASDGKQPMWQYRYGKLLLDRGEVVPAAKSLAFAVDAGEKLSLRPGWLPQAEFFAAEALRRVGQGREAVNYYKRYLEIAPINAPDRRAAQGALKSLM